MKAMVAGLAELVRRFPKSVVLVTLGITMVLGSFAARFLPGEDQNEAFAPEAPEIEAAETIGELFGEESMTSVMQVIVSSEAGEVYTVDGLNAADAITRTVVEGAFKDVLVFQGGSPVLSFLSPVQGAIQQGAPVPATDAELRASFQRSVEQMPDEQAGFVAALLPTDADASAPTASQGLMIIFTTGPESADDIQAFVDLSAEAAAEISDTPLPPGYTAEPFSFELLFSDQDEFQTEIGRLFGTAFLIIALVLAMVFLVRPKLAGARVVFWFGLVSIVVSIFLTTLPTLAIVLDGVFPDWLKDLDSNALFLRSAVVLVVTFGVWVFIDRGLRRTAADAVITLLTIGLAITWMNGLGFLLFEDQSPMAQILPILLIGLGVDYAIHVNSRYREEVSGGLSVDDSIGAAIRTVGVALVLATLTTAVGFLTNLSNDLPALREFGALAAIGIIASFLLMLTFVPAVRELLDRRAEAQRRWLPARMLTMQQSERWQPERLVGGDQRALGKTIGSTSSLAKNAAGGVTIVALLLGGFGAWGTTNLDAKFSFLDFIPTTSPLRATFETLIDDFGGGFGENTQVLIEGDVATADGWNQMVAANGNLVDTPNVVTFAGQPAGASPIAALGQLVTPDSELFSPAVGQAVEEVGVDRTTFMFPEGTDMAAIYDVAFAEAPQLMGSVLHQADGGGYDAALFDFTSRAGETSAGQLRGDVNDDFSGVSDLGLTAIATSDEIINDVIVTTLRDSQLSSLLLTLVAALLLLVINFWFEARRPMLGVITTIPVILVVLWSFALMAAFGIPFGPVTATISALAIGIGIPYMIHITHRFLEDRGREESVSEAIETTLANTGGALAGSALTTVAGFGILVTSTTIPFRQFGFVTAYTILLAMLSAILVLPSMLVLWSNWHAERGHDSEDEVVWFKALDEAAEHGG